MKSIIPIQRLLFASILILSLTVNGEEWTKREWEAVNRSGIAKFGRRRIKGSKSEKSDKSGKSGSTGKSGKAKKDSKKEKMYHNQFIDDGMTAGDLNDIYEGFFQNHFSLGSMSMNHATSNNMLALKATETRYEPDSENDKYISKYSKDDVKISFAQYSLIFSFMDSVIPTRRDDYDELVTATKSTFLDFMVRSYASNTNSHLNNFEVEFVQTGLSQLDDIYVVFQSTATFDSASYTFPEASEVQNTLRDSLAQDETLWMEYITALQEMNPDNAFSSTVDVEYTLGVPDEYIQSGPSKADKITYAAAACITTLSILAFGVKRSRDRSKVEDPYFFEKTSGSRLNESCESTIAETLSFASSIYGKERNSFLNTEYEEIESSQTGLSSHFDPALHRTYMCAQSLSSVDSEIEDDSIKEGCLELIPGIRRNETGDFDNGSLDHIQEDYDYRIKNNIVPGYRSDHDQQTHSSNRRWYSLQERQSKRRNRSESQMSKLIDDHSKSSSDENDMISDINEAEQQLEQEQGEVQRISGKKAQDQLEQETKHEREFRNEKGSRHDSDKCDSEEKLRAELAIIRAEEAARSAEELRLKEERRLCEKEKEVFQTVNNKD